MKHSAEVNYTTKTIVGEISRKDNPRIPHAMDYTITDYRRKGKVHEFTFMDSTADDELEMSVSNIYKRDVTLISTIKIGNRVIWYIMD